MVLVTLPTVPPYDPRLYIVCCYSNPCHYQSRRSLYHKFVHHVLYDLKIRLMSVLLNADDIVLEQDAFHEVLHVSNHSVLWVKENLLNIGISHLPKSCRYVAWVDADITFTDPVQVRNDIIRTLYNHKVVQCFSTAIDMDQYGIPSKTHFSSMFTREKRIPEYGSKTGSSNHCGYAWAARRDVVDSMGGLFEYGIVGSGDRIMTRTFLREPQPHMEKIFHGRFIQWRDRVQSVLRAKDVGCLQHIILHGFHGAKEERGYETRWSIINGRNRFDVDQMITKNEDGVLEWTDSAPAQLIDDVVVYFQSRNEDLLGP